MVKPAFFAFATLHELACLAYHCIFLRVVHIMKICNQTTPRPDLNSLKVNGTPKLHHVWVQTVWILMFSSWRGSTGVSSETARTIEFLNTPPCFSFFFLSFGRCRGPLLAGSKKNTYQQQKVPISRMCSALFFLRFRFQCFSFASFFMCLSLFLLVIVSFLFLFLFHFYKWLQIGTEMIGIPTPHHWHTTTRTLVLRPSVRMAQHNAELGQAAPAAVCHPNGRCWIRGGVARRLRQSGSAPDPRKRGSVASFFVITLYTEKLSSKTTPKVLGHLSFHGVHQKHVHVFLSAKTQQHCPERPPRGTLISYAPAQSHPVFCHTRFSDTHIRIRTTQHQEHSTENHAVTENMDLLRVPHAHGAAQGQGATNPVQDFQICMFHAFLPKTIMNFASRTMASFKSISISLTCLFVWFLFGRIPTDLQRPASASFRCLELQQHQSSRAAAAAAKQQQ